LFINNSGQGFERISQPLLDVAVARDLSTVLAWRVSPGQTVILAGNASYEDNTTNAPCVIQLLAARSESGQVGRDVLIAPTNAVFPGHSASIGPMALADVEGDGDLDLFVGGQVIPGRYPEAASSLLFRWHNGQWQLDTNHIQILANVGLVNGAVWSDLDGDGLPELVLACEWGSLRVFHNRAGTLHDMTSAWGFAELTGLWTGVTTGDFDEDGQLDILAGNWGLNSAEHASPRQPLTIFYGDFARLGRIDILETQYDPMRKCLTPRLQREALAAALPFASERFPRHADYSRASVAEVLGDRADKVRQLSATSLATTLFLNRTGRFEARALPLEAQFAPAFSVQVADFDGDGHEDAFLSQNFFAFAREESRLDAGRGLCLRGDGRGNLVAVPGQISGIKVYGEQRGAALADFDKDGRVDLVVSQNGAATKLYRNTRGRSGLRLHLKGTGSNPDAIGAVVRLRYADKWGPAREIHAGSGYWSQNSPVTVLGAAQSPTAISVRCPGGKTTETSIVSGATELVIQFPAQ
jgi:hypothetical protein